MGGVRDFVQSPMNLFRQWIACVVMTTVLLGPVVPQGVCLCEGCTCGTNFLVLAKNKGDCCCESLFDHETCSDNRGCCGSQSMPFSCPCSCSCSDIRQSEAIEQKGILLLKRPDVPLLWDAVSVFSVSFVPVSWGCLENPRILPPPHVPLHVLLCVFLN